MSEHPTKGILSSIMEGLKGIAEVNTIVGDAVETQSGAVIIPMSKVSVGFGMGGSDFPTGGSGDELFGGMGGGGVTIEPVAFLVVNGSDVRLINVDGQSPLDTRVIDLIPPAVEMISNLLSKKKDNAESV